MDRFRFNRLGTSRLQGDLFGGLTYAVARLMGPMGCLDRVRETQRFENRPEAVRAAVALLSARAASEGQIPR